MYCMRLPNAPKLQNRHWIIAILCAGGFLAIILPHAVAECTALMGGPLMAEVIRQRLSSKAKKKQAATKHHHKFDTHLKTEKMLERTTEEVN
jgi:hypothetical protein